MDIKLTPEVASAHKNLRDLCEKFEASVDEFCDLPPQSLRTKDFYESECVPIAVECVDALSKFETARSYEITAYEWTVAGADDTLHQEKCKLEEKAAQRTKTCVDAIAEEGDTLHQEKRKLEEKAVQRTKTYENAIAEDDDTLRQEKRKLEEKAVQRTKTYENAIAEDDDTLRQEKRKLEEKAAQSITAIQSEIKNLSLGVHHDLSDFTVSDPKELLKDTTLPSNSKISYREALAEAKPYKGFKPVPNSFTWMCSICGLAIMSVWVVAWIYSSTISSIVFPACGIFLIIFSFLLNMHSSKKKKKVEAAVRVLLLAAKEECNIIQKEMQNELVKTLAAHEEKVADIQAWKEQEDRQDAELAAKTLAAHEEKVADIQAWKEQEDRQDAELAAKTLAAHEEKVADIQAWKEQEDRQDAELAAKALAAHEERVKTAWEKKNQAMAYIEQEYKTFDVRLCTCLGEFQLFVDTWLTENANATSVLNRNQLQDLNRNSEEIESCLTRVGTVGIWDLSHKTSQDNSDNTKAAKPVTAVQPRKHTSDVQAARHYLNIIANGQGNNEVRKNLETIAKQGNTEAQFSLGGMYEKGISVQKNESVAISWYRKAVETGHKQALKNLTKMAEQGNTEAQFSLGGMYEKGRGVRKDETEAINWYRKAAETGHKQALKNLTKMAEQGNTEAQFSLGGMYEKGRGVRKDETEAINWYRKAAETGHKQALKNLTKMAEQGNTEAQFNLGGMYEKGISVQKKGSVAISWYRKAAETGHKQALKNLTKMAEQGNTKAQFNLGGMYEKGRGVRKDETEAVSWYRKAAETGHKQALKNLTKIVEQGNTDYLGESMEWYAKAAEQGHTKAQDYLNKIEDAEAQYQLGSFYEQENRDAYQAVEWYRKAAEQGP